jgi:hypothetical protein
MQNESSGSKHVLRIIHIFLPNVTVTFQVLITAAMTV